MERLALIGYTAFAAAGALVLVPGTGEGESAAAVGLLSLAVVALGIRAAVWLIRRS